MTSHVPTLAGAPPAAGHVERVRAVLPDAREADWLGKGEACDLPIDVAGAAQESGPAARRTTSPHRFIFRDIAGRNWRPRARPMHNR